MNLFLNRVSTLIVVGILFFSSACSEVSFKGMKYADLKSLDAQGRSGAILKNLPSDPSNQSVLNIKVENVSTYKYALISDGKDCSTAKYSAFIDESKPIADDLGDDGSKLICVIGTKLGYSPQLTPTQHTWVKDTMPPGEFALTGLVAIMKRPPSQITWSKSQGASDYNLKIATNADCSNIVQNFSKIKTESVAVNPLDDGSYFVCLEAIDLAGNKSVATNSGFNFTIDQIPPSAFNINRPIRISKVLNPEIQWSQSSSDAVYDLNITSDAGCTNIVAQGRDLTANRHQFAQDFQDMTDYHVCVYARDMAGNITPASNNGYKFTVDTSAIVVSFEPNSLPNDPSNTSQLNIDVIGQGISSFRYKIANLPSTLGAADSICADASDYSADIDIATNITNTVTSDGRKLICAYGGDAAGNWPVTGNVVTSFNHFAWTRSTALPTVSFDLAESCGPVKCPSTVAISNGRAARSISAIDITSLTMTVQDSSAGSLSFLQNINGTFGPGRQNLNLSLSTSYRFDFAMASASLINGRRYQFTVVARDLAGNASLPVTKTIIWDATPPEFTVTEGFAVSTREDQTYRTAQTTKVNYLKAKMSASDSYSKIEKYCMDYASSSSVAVPDTPDYSDKCWKLLPLSSQALVITAGNLPISVPFFPDTYKVYGWVMDFAGNISARSNIATVSYNPIKPPVFSHVFVTYTANDELPKNSNITPPASGGRDVYIRWAVSTRNPRGLKNLKLAYTLDEQNYTDTGINFRPDIRDPATCKLSAVNNSASQDYAGCIRYVLPASIDQTKLLRFRIIAEDNDGALTFGQTNALHLTNFTFLAGNTEAGLGSSALSAIINPKGTQSIAVHPSGQIFILDNRGLLFVDPIDGVLKVHPKSSSFRNPLKIALDKYDNLLVLDGGGTIKKLDLSAESQNVTTLIGGGTNTADTVTDPLTLNIVPSFDLMFFSAPNGDIYFMSETFSYRNNSNMRIRRAVESKNYAVESVVLQGQADNLFSWRSPTEGPSTIRIEDCNLISAAFTFSPSGSPTAMYPLISPRAQDTGGCWLNKTPNHYSQFYDYATFRGAVTLDANQQEVVRFSQDATLIKLSALANRTGNPPGIREGLYVRYFQSLSGRLYARVNGVYLNNDYIASYNPSTGSWVRIAGQESMVGQFGGYGGECVDGTRADQCALNVSSIFVDINDRVYMMDNDVVRVIQDDGKILTIAGESRSAGNGKNPLNARFNKLAAFDIYPKNSAATKFVISDGAAMSIREFTENGTIDSVAGNGIDGVDSRYEVWSTTPAKELSLSWGNDAPNSGLVVDELGNIIVTKIQTQIPYRINRSTGKWESLTGSQTLPKMFITGGGGYGAHVVGMTGNSILFGTFNWLPDRLATGNARLYTLPTTGTMPPTISPVLAKPNADDLTRNQYPFVYTDMLCPAGTSRLDCNGLYFSSAQTPQATFDAENQKWHLGVNSTASSRISAFKITSDPSNDKIENIITFPSDKIESFTIAGTEAGANKRAYVCLNSGVIKKFTLTAAGASAGTQITLPVPQMKCSSASGSMIYSTARRATEGGTLIFSYELNGLQGVAEMVNP